MQATILAFGIAKDILGGNKLEMNMQENTTVADLKKILLQKYPAFGSLNSLAIAVNCEYAHDNTLISENDEIVLVPPVSGG
ncbi:MAG: MoaD/ThiS family protein [Bacteroidetes bacterium]|nr:MoaD/ThiS family protein [Bacteroidota bacterium]